MKSQEEMLAAFRKKCVARFEEAIAENDFNSATALLFGVQAIDAGDWGNLESAFISWEPEQNENET